MRKKKKKTQTRQLVTHLENGTRLAIANGYGSLCSKSYPEKTTTLAELVTCKSCLKIMERRNG